MLHPLVEEWFRGRFAAPSPVQAVAWPAIASGRDTLVAAPTGSGKTLAAFLHCLDALVRDALAGTLVDETRVVYVSPLRALSNDIQKNLEEPLAEIARLAEARGQPLFARGATSGALGPIRTAVRTGDTSAADRRSAAKKPPHVLVTTPESLFLLLTSVSGRQGLASARTVIVDEIHALAGDKRGAHLALSIERLEDLCVRARGARPQRIGLSATMRPIEVAARLLVGGGREPIVVDTGMRKDVDLEVLVPRDELGAVATNEQLVELYDRLADLARAHTSTLVFVNTRRLAERVTHALGERLGEDVVAAHHGSLSRARRHAAETALKAGRLRVVVATASLELGIDVGAVDLACLVGSPRGIATAVQRVGRSGHTLGKASKGRLFPMTRDQLVECAAIVHAARSGTLDAIRLRDAPRDVLAQQVVAISACEEREVDDVFDLVRRAAPYADLARARFDEVLTMLAEGVATRRGRAGALVHHDSVNRKIRGRRGARLAALTSGGAIPDNANYDVVLHADGSKVGTLDEDFAIESMAGDVFLLGNTSWRIRRVEMGKVWVDDAQGAAPTVPFWVGEGPSRSPELSEEIGALRERVLALAEERGHDEAAKWLVGACGVERAGAELAVDYLLAGRAALGAVPTRTAFVAERFFDESGGMQLVIHAPLGARINRALGLLLRKRFCRTFDFELQAAATDDGVLFSLGPGHSFPLEALLGMLRAHDLRKVLEQAALQSPLFGTRFRHNATRSLTLLRFQNGKKVPPPLLRMRSDDLLVSVFPEQQGCQDNHAIGEAIAIPDHVLVDETMRDCLTEWMDMDGLARVLDGLERGTVGFSFRETTEPSVFCHEILNANPYAFLDDAPLEERRARAVSVRRGLPAVVAERVGGLDPEAIRAVTDEAQPDVRDADELHDVLLDLGAMPESFGLARGWSALFDALVAMRRAARLVGAGRASWVAAERRSLAVAAFPNARFEPEIVEPGGAKEIEREAALGAIVRAHLGIAGPTTVGEVAASLGVDADDVSIALAKVELEGNALRGSFRPGATDEEWCDRRLLARIHRATTDGLRRAIEPVSAADFLRFSFRWQGLRGARPTGSSGVLRAIDQLQGFELAAGAWEDHVLPARVEGYRPEWLDELCLAGEVVWGRFSPRDVAAAPTRSAPIAFARRSDLAWLLPAATSPGEPPVLGEATQAALALLRTEGASFFEDIARGIDRPRAETADALGELVALGLVTGDAFAALRSLLGPSRAPLPPAIRYRSTPVPASTMTGRFALLRAPRGPELDAEATTEALARQYLRRYGVVFRDVLVREPRAPSYRDLLRVYRRLEMRGEVRGGRLVAGFVGEQFALPEALDALRAVRKEPASGDVVRLAAADPLNLVGIVTAGGRVPAQLGRFVAYRDGVPIDAEAVSTMVAKVADTRRAATPFRIPGGP